MTTTLRLFSIEARRNAAIWFVPIIVAISWWLLDTQYWTPLLWTDTNRELQYTTVQFAGPAIAGVAAWMAGRNRRRGMEDLLNSTPCPATRRQLILWAATALWGLVAYVLFAAYMMGQTTLQATAGGPAFWPVAIVIAAMLAHAAGGFFTGQLLPSRFTAPLVGIGALGLQQLAAQYMEATATGSMSTWVNQLAAHNGHSEWHALFYLGLTGAALAAMALRNRRNAIGIASFMVTTGLAAGSVVMIWGLYPRSDFVITVDEYGNTTVTQRSTVPRNNFGQAMSYPAWTPSEPVCEGSQITVCADPAHQSLLDEAVVSATALIEPLLGLPNVPLQMEQEDTAFHGGPDARIDVSRFADKLVADEDTIQDGRLTNETQITIRSWLQERVGMDHQNGFGGCNSEFQWREGIPAEHLIGEPTQETCAATERFAALSTADQRAWLEGHYTALRAGELTLDDLP